MRVGEFLEVRCHLIKGMIKPTGSRNGLFLVNRDENQIVLIQTAFPDSLLLTLSIDPEFQRVDPLGLTLSTVIALVITLGLGAREP